MTRTQTHSDTRQLLGSTLSHRMLCCAAALSVLDRHCVASMCHVSGCHMSRACHSHRLSPLVQSHLSESLNEISFVKSLHPEASTYAGVYEANGLLHSGAIMVSNCWDSICDHTSMQMYFSVSSGRKKSIIARCPRLTRMTSLAGPQHPLLGGGAGPAQEHQHRRGELRLLQLPAWCVALCVCLISFSHT